MQIKKFLATGLSAIMAGATLAGGAVAQTLDDYPDFLGNNGQLDVFVVVGADAQPADIVGAGDVVAGLASLSYVMVSGSTATSTIGGQTEDMDIGTALNATDSFGSTVDDDDVDGFFDGEISISVGDVSDTYDVHDELRLGDGSLGTIKVQTGLTASSPDEDFGSDIFLEVLAGAVEYRLVFDENLKNGNYFANATSDDPITIDFMGRELIVTGATATSITADVGEKFILKAGESATTSDGKVVTLEKAVSTTKAQVIVDGQTDIITENSVTRLGGTEVKVTDVADDDGIEFDSATLIVGTAATNFEASDTYNDGDEYVIPCGTLWKTDGCDADDPDWVWNLAGLDQGTASSIVLGVIFDERLDSPEENPPVVGDEDNHVFDLPGSFAWISLDRVTTSDYQRYEFTDRVKDLREGSGAILSSSAHVLELNGAGNDDSFSITVNGTAVETDSIYLYINSTGSSGTVDDNDTLAVFYEDPDDGNKIKFATKIGHEGVATQTADLATMEFEGATAQLNVTFYRGPNGTSAPNFTIAVEPDVNSAVTAKYLTFYVEESGTSGQINYVGDSDSDTSKARDIVYGAAGTGGSHTSGGTDISGYEEDTRTAEGVIVRNPDGNAPSDKYVLDMPSEFGSNDFQVFVTIGSSGTSQTTTGSGGIKQLVPITGSVTKLDTEVSSSSVDRHLVLVGGPAVNRLTAEAMGLSYPSYGSASGIPENAAVIRIVDDAFTAGKTAVIVAGWEADDTRLATSVLQQAATKLAGVSATSVTVTGTSVASAVITPA